MKATLNCTSTFWASNSNVQHEHSKAHLHACHNSKHQSHQQHQSGTSTGQQQALQRSVKQTVYCVLSCLDQAWLHYPDLLTIATEAKVQGGAGLTASSGAPMEGCTAGWPASNTTAFSACPSPAAAAAVPALRP